MGEGLRNGFRPVVSEGKRARTFSRLQLLRFIVFVGGTRGIVGGRACTGLSLRESEARDRLIGQSIRVETASRMEWD